MAIGLSERQLRIKVARDEIGSGGSVSSAARRLGISLGALDTTLRRYAPNLLKESGFRQEAKAIEIADRRDAVKKLFEEHQKVTLVAEALGVSDDTVRSDLRALGVDYAPARKASFRTQVSLEVLSEMAATGMTAADAAKRVGVSLKTFYEMLRGQHGVDWSGLKGEALTDHQMADVRTLVARGGYTRAEAIRIVTRPRVRLSALPPEMRA